MATIVEFRPRRNEADAVRPLPAAAASPWQSAGDAPAGDAEIILMPLNWLKQLSRPPRRKPLKRRFALRELAPA
jgi:hypothetical protein